jgi:hypothetical protein
VERIFLSALGICHVASTQPCTYPQRRRPQTSQAKMTCRPRKCLTIGAKIGPAGLFTAVCWRKETANKRRPCRAQAHKAAETQMYICVHTWTEPIKSRMLSLRKYFCIGLCGAQLLVTSESSFDYQCMRRASWLFIFGHLIALSLSRPIACVPVSKQFACGTQLDRTLFILGRKSLRSQ